MRASYDDIRSRIQEEPKWYDENGVPRYCDFRPDKSSSIYAEEVVLLEIACQSCGERFAVEIFWDKMDFIRQDKKGKPSEQLKAWLKGGRDGMCPLHYGDPPIHDCAAGNTMNCIDVRVKEFWKQQGNFPKWVRIPELEVELEDPDD